MSDSARESLDAFIAGSLRLFRSSDTARWLAEAGEALETRANRRSALFDDLSTLVAERQGRPPQVDAGVFTVFDELHRLGRAEVEIQTGVARLLKRIPSAGGGSLDGA